MVDEEYRQQILLMFRAKDFESMWYVCKTTYESLGFKDATDQQMVDEFKWIVQQLRKFMFSKQDMVLGCRSIPEMIALVEDMIGRATEYGEDRKVTAYNFIRDHWLYELHNHLVRLRMDIELEEIPIEDEEE